MLGLAIFTLRGRLPVAEYYGLLSTPAVNLTGPIGDLADTANIPLLTAVLLGLIAAISPCQLSTNLAALAYVSREVKDPGRVMGSTGAYILGKVTVYTLVGTAIILAGLQLDQVAIPVIVVVRKILGPLMLLIGLFMLGFMKLNVSFGDQFSSRLQAQAEGKGVWGAYLLGLAFSLAVCPTLFWLFFGLLIPLGVSSTGGLLFPAIFAVGTTLPLLAFAAMTAVGADSMGSFLRKMRWLDIWVQRVVGVIFLLVGLNEVVLYWLI